jgi:hypothetical protein
MLKRLIFTKFSWLRFANVLFILCVLHFFSFAAFFARDEGTLGSGFFRNLLADIFLVLCYPVSFLIPRTNGPGEYYAVIFLNCVLWTLLIERLMHVFKYEKQI